MTGSTIPSSKTQIFQTNSPGRWQRFKWGGRILLLFLVIGGVVFSIAMGAALTARRAQTSALQEGRFDARSFPAVERAEFPNAQRCTIESLVALVGTHSRLLVMPAPERDRVLSQVADYLRGRPETSDGEFTAPLVTLVLRATRETSGAPGPAAL